MKATPLALGIVAGCLFYSCSKRNNPTPPQTNNSNIKITLVSGNDQYTQAGYPLPDSIVVRVTNNGQPVTGYQVQFVGSGCNADIVSSIKTNSDGLASYNWLLATNSEQTLWAVAVNGTQRVDLTTAVATTNPMNLPLKSACIPPNVGAESIVKLSTGRLLSCFNEVTSIRYSDDAGQSWNPLTSFGANHKVVLLATSSQNEVLAATVGEGIFYSNNGGTTWANLSPPAFNKEDNIWGLAFTNSGKIIFSGSSTDFFISADKGTTWSSVQSGLVGNTAYRWPIELNNGDLYLLSLSNYLFKSTNNGLTWQQLPNGTGTFITGICVDNNGAFYVATSGSSSNAFISVSKDNGTTFTNAFTASTGGGYLDNLAVINNNLFFDQGLGSGIYQLTNSNSSSLVGYKDLVFVSYTLNSQGQLVYYGLGPAIYGGIQGIYY